MVASNIPLPCRTDAFPTELTGASKWVVWRLEGRSKVPYCPQSPERKASVTDPRCWGTFDAAKAAYETREFSGLGYVLDGTGTAGVDLDDCVSDGVIDDAAFALLRRIGCQYIEISPSGTGLRGLGYARSGAGARGCIDGVSTELYTDGRYLTITGHCVQNGALAELTGWDDVWSKVKGRPTEESEDTDSRSSVSSVSSVGNSKYPTECIPTKVGQRHRCLFQLARVLKARYPLADASDMLPQVTDWHKSVVSVIGTKDFDITWAEFKASWSRVKFAHGEAILQQALKHLPDVPDRFQRPDYSPRQLHLIQICLALQRHACDEPFFLSCRIAGQLLNVHFTDAGTLLRGLVEDGILLVVKPGTRRLAQRYRVCPIPSTLEGRTGGIGSLKN